MTNLVVQGVKQIYKLEKGAKYVIIIDGLEEYAKELTRHFFGGVSSNAPVAFVFLNKDLTNIEFLPVEGDLEIIGLANADKTN